MATRDEPLLQTGVRVQDAATADAHYYGTVDTDGKAQPTSPMPNLWNSGGAEAVGNAGIGSEALSGAGSTQSGPEAAGTPPQTTTIAALCSLAVAMVINASNSAAFNSLNDHNSTLFMSCNVLCGTNLIGLLTLPIIFRRDLTANNVRRVTRQEWVAMFFGTLLFQVVGPFFFLEGLAETSISQAAILARLDQVEFYALSLIVLKEVVNRWDLAVNALTLLAVTLTIVVAPAFGEAVEMSSTSVFILVSTLGYSGSLTISKRFLTRVPIGIVAVFRLTVGTAAFHTYVLAVNPSQVGTLFSAEYWAQMAWYAVVYVTAFQALWLYVLAHVPSNLIFLGSASRFPMTIVFGVLINNDVPGGPQVVGATVMMAAVLVGAVKVLRERNTALQQPQSPLNPGLTKDGHMMLCEEEPS
jgi:drug/metabolite transporter (DMT)-like permease